MGSHVSADSGLFRHITRQDQKMFSQVVHKVTAKLEVNGGGHAM